MASGYPESYYTVTAIGMHEYPSLEGSTRADVCVIGGGFTGLSAALNLAERGLDVVLLEAGRVASGASGRNGGMIGSGQRKDILEIEAEFGLERARELWSLGEEAKDDIRSRVDRHAISCDLQDGQLVGVHKERYVGWAEEYASALVERYDYSLAKRIDREETRRLVATDDFVEGLYDAGAMTIHPLNYALGIATAVRKAGVRIFEGSRVTAYTQADPATVTTAAGTVAADFVVLACNGYLRDLEPRVAGKIMPINNFVITTEPLGQERANDLIAGRFGVHDTRFVVNYFRLTDDHRLLFGGGENYRRGFPRDIAGFVRPYMLKLFPQLAHVRIDYAWGGTLGITLSRLPHVGRLEPNLYFAQGFSGHGIPTANLAGKVLAEAITGQAARFDTFARLPVRTFPGGTLLRYPGMVLAMLYYALRDRI